jgi:hypothetical protein
VSGIFLGFDTDEYNKTEKDIMFSCSDTVRLTDLKFLLLGDEPKPLLLIDYATLNFSFSFFAKNPNDFID